MEKFAFSIPHYTSLYFKQILFLNVLGGQHVLWISDEKSRYGPQTQEKQNEKKDIAADYFCFSNHPFTANSIDSDSMALSVFLTLRLSNSLFLCPPGP